MRIGNKQHHPPWLLFPFPGCTARGLGCLHPQQWRRGIVTCCCPTLWASCLRCSSPLLIRGCWQGRTWIQPSVSCETPGLVPALLLPALIPGSSQSQRPFQVPKPVLTVSARSHCSIITHSVHPLCCLDHTHQDSSVLQLFHSSSLTQACCTVQTLMMVKRTYKNP